MVWAPTPDGWAEVREIRAFLAGWRAPQVGPNRCRNPRVLRLLSSGVIRHSSCGLAAFFSANP